LTNLLKNSAPNGERYAPSGYWWARLGTIPALSRDEITLFYRNQLQATQTAWKRRRIPSVRCTLG